MPARSVILTSVNHLGQMGQRFTNEKLKDFVQRLPDDVLVINSMFTNNTTKNHEIYTAIHRYKPKHIIMTMWSEPHWYSDHLHIIEKIIEPTGIPYTLFGQYATTDSTVFFDFWILVFNNFCTRYDNKELLPSSPNKLFLNYNRSPRLHRTKLVQRYEESDLLMHGHVSHVPHLGRGAVMVIDETLPDFAELFPKKSTKSEEPLFVVPNDPFSLGDLNIWRDHVVHVVSDGLWVEKPNRLGGFMLCEKHWKPILGLRPFLVNGSYDGYLRLKEHGIDVFEDQFPGDRSTIDSCHDTIISALQRLSLLTLKQQMEWYNSLMPRLLANQQRYYELVAQAQHQLENFTCPQ